MTIQSIELTKYEQDDFIVQALIKAKSKEEKAEKAVIKAGVVHLVILLVAIVYTVVAIFMQYQASSFFTAILNDGIFIVLVSFLIISFVNVRFKKESLDKAEKDYDELREDVIDRSPEIWEELEFPSSRKKLYEFLLEKHDINLFHK
ncbi:DUF2663 family protein [Alteribacter populi]|uniref:DUF2663 family protein n=1 Tax=Alteribacter populi TaxID=2011011 RepID=UPI0012FE0A1B|nr:DUF2663 family protein [Alteribacter populi]